MIARNAPLVRREKSISGINHNTHTDRQLEPESKNSCRLKKSNKKATVDVMKGFLIAPIRGSHQQRADCAAYG